MRRAALVIAALVVLADQITKHLAEGLLEFGESVPVLPFLDLRLAYNPGAAFSFLSDAGGWQRWFFVLLALGVSAYIVHWLWRLDPRDKWSATALALILGGALGNVIDRVLLGHVIDFIDVYYRASECAPLFATVFHEAGARCHWPAFNVADSSIFVGAALLLAGSFISHHKE